MNADLLIHSAAQLCIVPGHASRPQRGARLGDMGAIADGAVAMQDGRIVAVGTTAEVHAQVTAKAEISAAGCLVTPGFVDPHTHVVFAGDRAGEFEMRLAGATYMQIMAAGGGIMSTVRATRAASVEQLVAATRPRLDRMLAHGTTTVEAKTGYGLTLQDELKQLDAIERLNATHPMDLVATFLAAHAVPTEYREDPDAYVDQIVAEMLPAVAPRLHKRAPLYCDVFCEDGAFTLDQSRRILERAKALGFGLKVHADEFAPLGGTALAVELGATSADHLLCTPSDEIALLGQADTIAIALPGTPFGLGQSNYAPAQALLDAGAALALATDCNPGTSWCESMPFILALACRTMRLTPAQALAAATINAAYAVGRGDEVGSLEVGKQADILIHNVPDYRHLAYRFGTNPVAAVIKRGTIV
jgi:imidazolonepropionase